MEQHINKVNATTKDYRGNKSVLNQRVIEGVSSTVYDLSTDLQLEENTPKTIIINNVDGGNIFLPNAKTLLSGWKITIINESTDNGCNIYYYDSSTLFASVDKNRMTELIFLGKENDNDEQGKWKVVILSESVVNDTDTYTTNVYSSTKINYKDLGNSFTYNTLLAKIDKNTPVKSIYVKTLQQFSGANVNLNVGTLDSNNYFYDNLILNQDLTQRDLFNEILDVNNDQYVVGQFFIPGATTNAWTAITSNISDTITSAKFDGTNYVLQANDTLYITDTLSANITFQTVSITDFGFDSYSDYSLQYEKQTGYFYFFGVKDNRLCYTKSQDGLVWETQLITNNEFTLDSIKYITKIYNEQNNKWFISVIEENDGVDNNYIIYIDDITVPSTWSKFELKYNDTFIEDINNIACDFTNLVINTDTATYYSTNNGYSLQLIESYNDVIYKFKYINNRWIRFAYNDADTNSFKYIFDFNSNINSWLTKNLPRNTIIDSDVNYILDIDYDDGLWLIFRAYQLEDDEHLDLITSTDFFETILPINTQFSGDNLTCICGNSISGYLITGENGKLTYSDVSSSFSSLTQGEVEIIVEYADSINPINLLNPIIQGQIMPLGTIINYPFARTIPAGYIRLDGTKIKNIKNDFPEFYDLLQKNPQMIYGGNEPIIAGDGDYEYNYDDISKDNTNNSDWKNLVKANNGNFPKFVWVNNTDIRTPVINCFISGFIGDITTDFAQYFSDGLPNITGYWREDSNAWCGGAFYNAGNGLSYGSADGGGSSFEFRIDTSNLNYTDLSGNTDKIYGKYDSSNDITLKNKVIPAHITYPYIMAYFHTAQDIGTYNLQTMGELLEKLDADIILAQKTINDLTRQIPAGTILPFSGSILPDGFLWCDGNSYMRTTYTKLFSAIGTNYGDDNGNPDKFNVPDLRYSRVPISESTNFVLGTSGGEETHILTIQEMPSHNHSLNLGSSTAQGGNGRVAFVSGTYNTTFSGGGQAHNNMQPYFVIKGYIIKY